jgi:hypothetical protein
MDDEKQTLELLEDLSLKDDQSSEKYLTHNEPNKHVTDGKLLNKTNFRLLFVDENDNMSIIIPANNPQEKVNVKKRGYRCISHLWGANARHPWKDHNVVGVEHDVEIRDSNKKKCLELFMKHKGYWWMDVFCVNQVGNDEKKPIDKGALDIMGYIYKNCKECYCILDGLNNISGQDLDEANFMYNLDEDDDIFDMTLEKSNVGREIYPFLFYITGSDWVNRVWTLQECVLSEKVYFVAEYDGSPIVSLDDVICLCENLENVYSEETGWSVEGLNGGDIPEYPQELADKYEKGIRVLREIRKIALEYTNLKSMRELRRENTTESTLGILEQLTYSYRKSTKEVDYVYGVAGLLDITVKGDTMDEIYVSMIANLWSKNIFMSMESNPRQMSGLDEEEGLSEVFARKIYGGAVVISNKSRRKPKSVLEYNFGTVIHSIYSGNRFRCTPSTWYSFNCMNHSGHTKYLCTECVKTYKEDFAIAATISGKFMKLGASEISELLSGDKDEKYVLRTCRIVEKISMNNIYVTEKYIIALECNEYHVRDDGLRVWSQYDVGDDITIPVYGEFQNLYVDRWDKMGYEFATIVNIDRCDKKTSVGCIYHRKDI